MLEPIVNSMLGWYNLLPSFIFFIHLSTEIYSFIVELKYFSSSMDNGYLRETSAMANRIMANKSRNLICFNLNLLIVEINKEKPRKE